MLMFWRYMFTNLLYCASILTSDTRSAAEAEGNVVKNHVLGISIIILT